MHILCANDVVNYVLSLWVLSLCLLPPCLGPRCMLFPSGPSCVHIPFYCVASFPVAFFCVACFRVATSSGPWHLPSCSFSSPLSCIRFYWNVICVFKFCCIASWPDWQYRTFYRNESVVSMSLLPLMASSSTCKEVIAFGTSATR